MSGDTSDTPDLPPNPPGYGETIGGVVYYDSPPAVVEAACRAYWPDWDRLSAMSIGARDEHRVRMKCAIRAAVEATCGPSPAPTGEDAS